ncbi:hypothetical protein JXB12_05895 [candidate division KSB1 bacterium]|nr:hypothetical protein [candidate division KSB1 bacterium]
MKKFHSWLCVQLICIGIVSSVILLSCSERPEELIVGVWTEVDGTETIQFFADSTLKIDDEGTWMEGTYTIDNKRQIEMKILSLNPYDSPLVYNGTLSEDKLIFTLPEGKTLSYTKAK